MPSSYPIEKQSLGSGVTLTTTVIPYTFDLPAHVWQIGGVVQVTASSSATLVKAYAYLDEAQTVKSGALLLSSHEVTNVVTVLSIGSGASGGVAFSVLGSAGGVKVPVPLPLLYGIQVTVSTSSVTATPGTFSGAMLGSPVVMR